MKEIGERIPNCKERQIYKMMFPLVQYQCKPQLNFITKEYILKPLFDDDLKLFRGPNQYSVLLMSFGFQFITDDRKLLKRDVPEGPANSNREDGRPFRFSLFQRFHKQLLENHQDLLFEEKDPHLLIYILYTYVLNNSLDFATMEKMVKNLQLNITESDLRNLNEPRLANLARSLKNITDIREMK